MLCDQAAGLSKPVSVSQIVTVKKAALRRNIWFKALSRVERGILDLTVRCVVNIKSPKLASLVTAILNKLKLAAESLVDRLVRTVGFSLSQKLADLATGWGNRLASRWVGDVGFACYLAVMQFNAGRGFSV
jgi:hypothetical protein